MSWHFGFSRLPEFTIAIVKLKYLLFLYVFSISVITCGDLWGICIGCGAYIVQTLMRALWRGQRVREGFMTYGVGASQEQTLGDDDCGRKREN